MNSILCGSPGTNAVSNSADFTRFHASFARLAPSGKGRAPARYAFMAMSFPRMTRISSLSVRWEEATTGQLRYPSGMVTPTSGDARSRPAFAGIGRSCASARRNTPRNRTARGANDRMIFPLSALSGRAFDLRYYTSIRNRRVRSPSVAGVGPRWYNPPSWIRGRKVAAGEELHAPSLLSRRGRLLFLRARHHPPSRTGRGQVRVDPPGDARLRGLRD